MPVTREQADLMLSAKAAFNPDYRSLYTDEGLIRHQSEASPPGSPINPSAMTRTITRPLYLSLITLLFFIQRADGQDRPYIALREGMLLDAGAYIRPGEYVFSGQRPVIVEGENIDLQFDGVTIRGAVDPDSPDRFTGVAIIVRNARNVRIGNLKAHGFHTALVLENCTNVYIYNCDFSYNYRPQLQGSDDISTDDDRLGDLSGEADGWRALGAGIYGRRVYNSRLEGNRITGGQHGILLAASDSNLISGNMIIYNSGVGLGLYDSRGNTIRQNHLDFNIRGMRTDDTPAAWGAGLLLVGASCGNTVEFNSLTHCSDGVAGLYRPGTTGTDPWQGNRFYRNDCSYNLRSGLTLSQASGDELDGNVFEDCTTGTAIYSGTHISIKANAFNGTDTAIVLHGVKDISVLANTFTGTDRLIIRDKASGKPVFRNNRSSGPPDRSIGRCERRRNAWRQHINDATGTETAPADLAAPEGYIPDRKMFPCIGRACIHMTAWGPYDYRFPAVFRIEDTSTASRIVLLGPVGADWQTDRTSQFTGRLSQQSGQLPDTLLWSPDTVLSVQQATFACTGAYYPDIFGRSVAGAHRTTVTYIHQAPSPLWDIKTYKPGGETIATEITSTLAPPQHLPRHTKTPYTREASTTLALSPGEYRILLRYSEPVSIEINGTTVYTDEESPTGSRTISRPVSIGKKGGTTISIRQQLSGADPSLYFRLIPGSTKY